MGHRNRSHHEARARTRFSWLTALLRTCKKRTSGVVRSAGALVDFRPEGTTQRARALALRAREDGERLEDRGGHLDDDSYRLEVGYPAWREHTPLCRAASISPVARLIDECRAPRRQRACLIWGLGPSECTKGIAQGFVDPALRGEPTTAPGRPPASCGNGFGFGPSGPNGGHRLLKVLMMLPASSGIFF